MVIQGVNSNPFSLSFNISVDDNTVCYYTDVTLEAIPLEYIPLSADYTWDFGSGSNPTSAVGPGPHVVQYTTAGTKTVTCTINYQGNETVETTTVTVSTCYGNITGTVKDTFGVGIQSTHVRLYEDFNEDGVADNATVIRSVFCTSQGVFSMANLTPGSYVIQCINPSNYTIVIGEDTTADVDAVANVPNTDLIIPVTIRPGIVDTNNAFIFTTNPGTISGYVFVDSNSDQVPDVGEGVAGVTVEIYEDENQDGISDGILIDSTVTDADGYYEFTNVATNTYTGRKRHGIIVVTIPGGYSLVTDIDTSNDGDTVANSNTANGIIPLSLSAGEVDAHNHFILQLIP